jgi:hypothetical protein
MFTGHSCTMSNWAVQGPPLEESEEPSAIDF